MLRSFKYILAIVCAAQLTMQAQEFKLFEHKVQVHGWVSQGFVKTDNNNWLTMDTSSGSAGMTDMGLNMSMQVSDNLRIGAQVYDRNLGELGQYHPSLDWAVVDFKPKSWLGFRGGKVKTVFGLYNDTQDQDFIHTFALLPQSIYPTDLRDATIAHTGGDVYGRIPLTHGLGSLGYTVFAGHRTDTIYSGYPYLLTQFGVRFTEYGGLQYGGDLRWHTPVNGLVVGYSRLDQDTEGTGTRAGRFAEEHSIQDWTNQFYGQYAHGRLRIDSEYRRYLRDQRIQNGTNEDEDDVRGWYIAGAYRLKKWLELGSYYSDYSITASARKLFDRSLPQAHIHDKVITANFDANRFWNIKVEGHFMEGFGNAPYPNGFYPQVNPTGFQPDTNALVLKTSLKF